MIDEDDLAAGLHDTGQLIETRLRLGHDGQNVRRDNRVEMSVWESELSNPK